MNKEIRSMSNKQLAIGLSEMLEQHTKDQKQFNQELTKVYLAFNKTLQSLNENIDRLNRMKLAVKDDELKSALSKTLYDLKEMDQLLVRRQKHNTYWIIYLLSVIGVFLFISVLYLLLFK